MEAEQARPGFPGASSHLPQRSPPGVRPVLLSDFACFRVCMGEWCVCVFCRQAAWWKVTWAMSQENGAVPTLLP